MTHNASLLLASGMLSMRRCQQKRLSMRRK